MRLLGVIAMLWLFFIPGVTPSARMGTEGAQPYSEICPAYVNDALRQLQDNCSQLGRNSACYGYDSVFVTFNQPMPDEFFTRPADRAELKLLHTIQTTPLDLDTDEWGLALLNVQANVPHTLPGQAVVFLLLGGIEIENRVSPDDLPVMTDPVPVRAAYDSNLRTHPNRTARITSSVLSGTRLLADAVSQDEHWVRVLRDNVSPLWIYRDLLQAGAGLELLPRVNPTHMSPMQAFRFHTGIGAPMCEEATETLIIQGPDDIQVDIEANGAVISIASTIALNITETGNLRVTTLSGTAYVDDRAVPAGYSIEAPMDENGDVNGPWLAPRQLEPEELNGHSVGSIVPAEVLHYAIPEPSEIKPTERDTTTLDSVPDCLPPECMPPGLIDKDVPDSVPECLPPECTPPGLVDKDVPDSVPECLPPECDPPGLVGPPGLQDKDVPGTPPECVPPVCEPPGLDDKDLPDSVPECLPPECAPPGLGDDGPPGLGGEGPPGQSVRP